MVERDGNLKRITRSTLRTKRQEYKVWKADLDMRGMQADRLWEEAQRIIPELLSPQRAYTTPNIIFNIGEITIEEAVRRDRASRKLECSQEYVDHDHNNQAIEIFNLIYLKHSEIADVRKLCQVPGVGWRDAIFAVPRHPPQDEISRDGIDHTRTPGFGENQDREESFMSGQVSCCLIAVVVLVLSWWF